MAIPVTTPRIEYYYQLPDKTYTHTTGDPIGLGYVKIGERLGKPIYTKPELAPPVRTYTPEVWGIITPSAQEELRSKYTVQIVPKPRPPLEARRYTKEAWAMVAPEVQVRMATEYNIQFVTVPVVEPIIEPIVKPIEPVVVPAGLTAAQLEMIRIAAGQIGGLLGFPFEQTVKKSTEDIIKQVEVGNLEIKAGKLIVTEKGKEVVKKAGGTIVKTSEGEVISPYVPPEVVEDPFVPTYEPPYVPPVHVPTKEELARMLEIAEEKRITTLELGKIPGEITSAEEYITSQTGERVKAEESITAIEGMIADIRVAPEVTFDLPDQLGVSRSEALDYLNKQANELEDMQRLVKTSPADARWDIPGKPSATTTEALKYLSGMLSDVNKSITDVKKVPDVSWDIGTKKGLSRGEAIAYLEGKKGESEEVITSIKKGVGEAEEYLTTLPGYKAELEAYQSELWAYEYGRELPPMEIRKTYVTPEEQEAAARLGIHLPTEYEPLSVSELTYGVVAGLAEPARELGFSPEMIATMVAMPVAALETTPILGMGISEAAREMGLISPEARIGLFGAEEAPPTVGWAFGVEAGPLWAQTPEAKFMGLMSELGADILLGKAAAVTYKAGLKVAKKVAAKVAKVEPLILKPITTRITPEIYETVMDLGKTRLGREMEARLITRVEDVISPEGRLMFSQSIGVAEVPKALRIVKKKVKIAAKAVGIAEEVSPELTKISALGRAGEFGLETPFVAAAEVRKLKRPIEVMLEPLPEVIRDARKVIGVKYFEGVKLADYMQETAGFVRPLKKVKELAKRVKVEELERYYGLIGEYTPEARRFLEETTFGRLVPEVIKKIEPGTLSKKAKKLITDLYKKEYYTKKTYDSLIKKAKKIGDLPTDKVPRELTKIADKFENLKAYDEAIELRRAAEGARAYLAEASAVAAVETLMKPSIMVKPFEPAIIPKPPKVIKPVIKVKEVPMAMPTRTGQLMLQKTLVKEKVRVEPLVEVEVKAVKPKELVRVKPRVKEFERSKEFERIREVTAVEAVSETMQEQLQIIKPKVKVKVEPMVEQLRKTKELEMVSPMVKELERVRVEVKVKPAVKVKVAELLKPSISLKELTRVSLDITPIPRVPTIKPPRIRWTPTPGLYVPAPPPPKRLVKVKKKIKLEERVYDYSPSLTAKVLGIEKEKEPKREIYYGLEPRPVIVKKKPKKKVKKKAVRKKPKKARLPSMLRRSSVRL